MTLNIGAELCQAQDEMEAACARIADVQRAIRGAPAPLPAPALTEQSIVDALKSDPAMAGRVIARFADSLWSKDKLIVSDNAKSVLNTDACSPGGHGALQSLAVALAAASYRG